MEKKVKDYLTFVESMKSENDTHTYDDVDLKDPEKADLDNDGEISDYEYKRAKAIEKSEDEEEGDN